MTFGFFADDLTGAADVLAQAHAHGLDAALVLDPASGLPDAADVVGVAGTARSLSGTAFDTAVRDGLAPFTAVPGLELLLYKVCSTFDSSPTIGSIGRGIELLGEAFPGHGPVPVLPAQPDFGRHTAFSQHFGRSGDQVYRLDRHPVMSRHPSTPMHEADLRRVLADQLNGRLDGAPDLPAVHLPAHLDGSFPRRWTDARGGPGPAFVVDAVSDDDMDRAAAALLADGGDGPALVVGSGGIMAALARRRGHATPAEPSWEPAAGPALVVSASASAVTASQIDDALEHGWTGVPVPVDPGPADGGDDDVEERVAAALARGEDVVAYTTRGPDDPAFRSGTSVDPSVTGARIGAVAARMAHDGLTRDVVICGGDTSGHALAALGVREVRMAGLFVPVAPICRTDGGSALAGSRLVLKGGQVGPPDIFRRLTRGSHAQESRS
ncbi:MAG: four-carbon acid sugar kinase family protein [Pseudonocardia sediminis]